MKTRWLLALGAASMCISASASADDDPPPGATRGTIPVWGVGLQGGIVMRPYSYVSPPLYDGDTPSNSPDTNLSGVVGPVATVNIDLGNIVLVGAGSLSFAQPMVTEVQTGAVFGYRFWSQYSELVGSQQISSTTVLNTYEVYTNKYIPSVFGGYAGVGYYNIASATSSTYDGTPVTVPGGSTGTLEFGLGLASRLGLIAAAAYDPSRSTWGGRMRMRAVFLGRKSLGLHIGMNLFGMTGSRDTQLPFLHATMDIGIGDGSNVF